MCWWFWNQILLKRWCWPLIWCAEKYYKITVDCNGKYYCSISLNWHNVEEFVNIFMPGNAKKILQQLHYLAPTSPQYAPHRWTEPPYGSKAQMAPIYTSEKLDKKGITRIQYIYWLFLYYAWSIDNYRLVGLNNIGSKNLPRQKNTFILKNAMRLCSYI